MRQWLLALAVVLPGAALAEDGPKGTIEAFYRPYLIQEMSFDSRPMYQSEGLNLLFEQDRKDAGGEIGRIDFDPYVQGQDWDTKHVEVTSVDNFGREIHLTFALVLERDGWKIDDVSWVDGEFGIQSLREILTAPIP
jgi:hypothetical protein